MTDVLRSSDIDHPLVATPQASGFAEAELDRPVPEFVGASDDTISEAVRRALANAAEVLHTLEGVGVLIVPQIYRPGVEPRYRVTLKVTGRASQDASRAAVEASFLPATRSNGRR